jgi:hypothetical protein
MVVVMWLEVNDIVHWIAYALQQQSTNVSDVGLVIRS